MYIEVNKDVTNVWLLEEDRKITHSLFLTYTETSLKGDSSNYILTEGIEMIVALRNKSKFYIRRVNGATIISCKKYWDPLES